MLKTLLKSRFLALWASLSQGSKKKRAGATGIILIVVFAFFAVYMLGVFTLMFFGVGSILSENNNEWALFTLASLIASSLCLFGSIFTTKTQMFESKDNELLLSMPIPPKYILISRILVLLIVNYLLEAIVMLPAMLAYGITIGYTFIGFVFAVLVFALIPFLTLALSSLIAWIISMVASKLRNKTLVSTVMFIAFFAIYMYFCFSFSNADIVNVDVSGLKNTFIFYFIGNSIANENILHFIYFILSAAVPSIITFIIISRSFIKILTTKKAAKKIEYKQKTEKSSSPFIALVKKELKRFFTSTAYIMNCGIGSIMLAIMSIIVAVNAPNILEAINVQFSEPTQAIPVELIYSFIPVIIAIASCFISSMSLVSTPSISLENKNLWILHALPIKPRTILFAKITNHMIICTPVSIIAIIIACASLKVSFIDALLVVLANIAIIAFTGYFGMFLGLKFPKFDWQNENVAVKQGFAIFGAMFGSMIYAMVLSVITFLIAIFNTTLALVIMIIPSLLLCALLHLYFVYKADKDFEKLKDK